MSTIKNIFISIGYLLGSILLFNLINCLFYNFDIIGDKCFKVFNLITIIVSIIISSFNMSKCFKNKYLLESIKFGFIIISILFLIELLFNKFSFRCLIYYLIILLCSICGFILKTIKKETN